MPRLSDVIAQALEETRAQDGANRPSVAAALVVDRVEPEDMRALAVEGAKLRCKRLAESVGPVAARAAVMSGQLTLFPTLHRGYALDDQHRSVKHTDMLSRSEFERVIAIREKQVADDRAHIVALREAYTTIFPFWECHPDWTFGQCCEACAAKRRGA